MLATHGFLATFLSQFACKFRNPRKCCAQARHFAPRAPGRCLRGRAVPQLLSSFLRGPARHAPVAAPCKWWPSGTCGQCRKHPGSCSAQPTMEFALAHNERSKDSQAVAMWWCSGTAFVPRSLLGQRMICTSPSLKDPVTLLASWKAANDPRVSPTRVLDPACHTHLGRHATRQNKPAALPLVTTIIPPTCPRSLTASPCLQPALCAATPTALTSRSAWCAYLPLSLTFAFALFCCLATPVAPTSSCNVPHPAFPPAPTHTRPGTRLPACSLPIHPLPPRSDAHRADQLLHRAHEFLALWMQGRTEGPSPRVLHGLEQLSDPYVMAEVKGLLACAQSKVQQHGLSGQRAPSCAHKGAHGMRACVACPATSTWGNATAAAAGLPSAASQYLHPTLHTTVHQWATTASISTYKGFFNTPTWPLLTHCSLSSTYPLRGPFPLRGYHL